jgi:flavin-dependent dehydrogenase
MSRDRDVPAYDVAVLGGGPAGCATALALCRRGVDRVLVVERDEDPVRIGESIPPESRLLLEQLGLWHAFVAEAHEPCLGSCSAWGADVLGYNDFLFNPHGTGWHLDRRRFDAFLARAAEAAGAVVRRGCRFDAAERGDDGGFALRLTQRDGERSVRARFVVDATGTRARFASAFGAQRASHDRLTCAAAFLELPASSEFSRLTMLEAVEDGWWYAARLPGGRVAVAVASDPDYVTRHALHARAGWLAALARTSHLSRGLAGCIFADDAIVVRTAPSFVLDPVAGDGWLAVGDAASAYDPISSQGIYKALVDALEAAEVVAARLRGKAADVAPYEAAVAARFADYLANRQYFYDAEQRWPDAPFWRRRRAAGDAAGRC